MLRRSKNGLISNQRQGFGEFPMRQQLARLDHVASKMNVWLVVIAIGLGMLDFSILITKGILAAMPVN
jgi:hypothetical protein